MDATKRKKIESLIQRLRDLERDASNNSNMTTSFRYGEELASRRISLEKKLLDSDIDTFYREEKGE